MTNKRSIRMHNRLVKKVLSDPAGSQEYKAYKLQLELADKLRAAREKSDITQEAVAEAMETTKSAIARLEAAGGSARHSPSLNTIIRYANAIGFNLNITLKKQDDKYTNR